MIYGRTLKGATPVVLSVDTKIVTRVRFAVGGRLPKITVLVDGNGGAAGAVQQVARGVVYAADVLLAEGDEVAVAAGQAQGWVDFTFSNIEGGVLLPAAGSYDVGVHAGPSSNVIRVWL